MTVGGEYMFDLQKLVDDKGKTIIPARYLRIQPISTQIALVQRSDGSVGYYDIATKKFRPVELGYGHLYRANKAPLPPTFILGTGPEDGLYNVCFITADGSCGKTVKRLKGRFSAPLDKQDILKINSSFIINQQDSANQRFSMTYDWSETGHQRPKSSGDRPIPNRRPTPQSQNQCFYFGEFDFVSTRLPGT